MDQNNESPSADNPPSPEPLKPEETESGALIYGIPSPTDETPPPTPAPPPVEPQPFELPGSQVYEVPTQTGELPPLPPPQPPLPAPQKPRQNRIWLIILIIVLVLCCCCLIALGIAYNYGDQFACSYDPSLWFCPAAVP